VKQSDIISILYHDIFKYSLSKKELVRWTAGKRLKLKRKEALPKHTHPTHTSTSNSKRLIADRAVRVLNKIPFILFVGITGSLAMNNAKPQSDIDLMIITKKDTLWITRLVALFLLFISGFKLRRAKNSDEKDKLCLNFWIDETALEWTGPRNAYIAHEIAQVVPLYDQSTLHSQWLSRNRWIAEYWPKAAAISQQISKKQESDTHLGVLNMVLYNLQRMYMKSKITRESVSIHHAYFHPYDWSLKVMKALERRGVFEV